MSRLPDRGAAWREPLTLRSLHKQLSGSGDELSIEFRPFQGGIYATNANTLTTMVRWMGANWRRS